MNLMPKRPSGPGWVKLPPPMWANSINGMEVWQHDTGICAITGVQLAEDNSGRGHVVRYELDFSFLGKRPCSEKEVQWVLTQFSLFEPVRH